MNKMWAYSRCLMTLAMLCLFFVTPAHAGVQTVTRIDDFSDPELPLFWTLDDVPESYAEGGSFTIPGDGWGRFNNVGNYAYAHIQTTSTLDTTNGIRVDAIMRQDHWPISTWGMGVTIYYNENNWISIKQGAAGGQEGWMRQGFINGQSVYMMGNTAATLRQYALISGVELTDTQIKFYGSSINPLQDHSVDGPYIDYFVSEITEFTMSRPEVFTGPATIIIGKGYTAPGYPNPHFNNSVGSDNWAFAGIAHVRIQRNIFSPDYCGDEGTVYFEMDFNQDCYVNILDFVSFASYWLQCNDPFDSYCDQFQN